MYIPTTHREGGPQRFRATAQVPKGEEAVFYLSYDQVLRRSKGAYTPTLYFAPSQVGGGGGEGDG